MLTTLLVHDSSLSGRGGSHCEECETAQCHVLYIRKEVGAVFVLYRQV
jgi:hypothetical protein